jgi:hypothetical protein
MLQAMQLDGRLQKVATDNITMTPTPVSEIPLDQLNVLIAEQKNCTIDDLCTFVKGYKKDDAAEVQTAATVDEVKPSNPVKPLQAANNEPLTDEAIAKSYRSQADALYKEAALLRKQADELDPPKKKVATKAKDTESA